MDKASKAIRRSSIRLKSISSGHQDLHLVISELRDVRSSAKAFMIAQNTAAQDMLRWSYTNEMKAMHDTFLQFAELNTLWTDTQREFIDKFKSFIKQFEMILEGEQKIDEVKSAVTVCERRETRIRKDLRNATRKSAAEEVRQLEIKLAQAERSKDLAKLEVLDRIKENEAVKLIRVKEGILKLSESYVDMASTCQIIHEANKDLADLLPDVQNKSIHEIEYAGSSAAELVVLNAKESVRHRQHRRSRIPISPSAPTHDDLPPPYSPNGSTTPYRPTSHNSYRSSHSNPQRPVNPPYNPQRNPFDLNYQDNTAGYD